jgi:hypothetical protein
MGSRSAAREHGRLRLRHEQADCPGHEPGAHPFRFDARAEQAGAGQDEAERKIEPLNNRIMVNRT